MASKLSGALRRAVESSKKSLTELARLSGVDAGRLSRFVRGERDITLEAAGAIAETLDLRLLSSDKPAPASFHAEVMPLLKEAKGLTDRNITTVSMQSILHKLILIERLVKKLHEEG